jgi:CheY-like chemotaxis protein
MKFTPKQGRVRLSVSEEADGKSAEIFVSDTGIGIPKEELPHIFDRFHQVDSSQTREYEGTGIGLSIVKEVVSLHRGTITVESVPGRGTEFRIRLPLDLVTDEEHTPPESRPVEPATPPMVEGEPAVNTIVEPSDASARDIILVIEDNADMRGFIGESLAGKYSVLFASNGEEGVSKAVAEIPDLVITDIMMPRMDGYGVCRTLRADQRTSHIPVIILTAKATEDDRIEGRSWFVWGI